MARVSESSEDRSSPSNHFSRNIIDMGRDKSSSSCTRTMAILCSILATVFLLSTVALAIVVGIKYAKDDDSEKPSPRVIVLREGDPEAQEIIAENHIELHSSTHTSAGQTTVLVEETTVAVEEEPLEDEDKEFIPVGGAWEEHDVVTLPGMPDFNNLSPMADEHSGTRSKLDWPLPSGSLFAHYRKAAVASDHGLCSEIGRDMMIRGGNAVDSMIATLLCIGVVNPQSSGLGGGFLMTLYNKTTGRCVSINARETAPLAATHDMFENDTKQSSTGYRSIATPSELHGYWTAFTKFGSGRVTWASLFEPSINLCLHGFPVSSNLAMILSEKEKEIQAEPTMRAIFVNHVSGRVYEEGEILKREQLGYTMQLLANATDPVELFYKGGVAQTIAAEITDNGGLVTLQDLKNYKTEVEENPLVSDELPGDLAMCGPPPPSSFIITQSIIAVMAEFYVKEQANLDDPLVYHRLIEAEKFAYAQRAKLGDTKFVATAEELVANMSTRAYIKKIKSLIKDTAQEQSYYSDDTTTQVPDHGTSHVSLIDAEGNAVSTTSTVNLYFGSMRASQTLGIIWNDQMDDFSTPGVSNAFGFAPSTSNYIAPGKRPMSSMSPMIIYNKQSNEVRMVVGASGGSFIISSTAQTVIRSLLFNQTIKEAVDAPRLHNQFLPHRTDYEQSFPKSLIEKLKSKYGQSMQPVPKQKSVVQALEIKEDGFVHGNSDFRRQTATYPAGY